MAYSPVRAITPHMSYKYWLSSFLIDLIKFSLNVICPWYFLIFTTSSGILNLFLLWLHLLWSFSDTNLDILEECSNPSYVADVALQLGSGLMLVTIMCAFFASHMQAMKQVLGCHSFNVTGALISYDPSSVCYTCRTSGCRGLCGVWRSWPVFLCLAGDRGHSSDNLDVLHLSLYLTLTSALAAVTINARLKCVPYHLSLSLIYAHLAFLWLLHFPSTLFLSFCEHSCAHIYVFVTLTDRLAWKAKIITLNHQHCTRQ